MLTRETLEVVPSSRAGIITLMNQSPSVRSQLDVGGSQSNQLPAMRVYGIATQATSWLVLDGVVTTDAGQTGGGGSYFDYASFEEARMQTIANDVETPNRGINLNLIVKSGGNDFHGDGVLGTDKRQARSPRISTTDLRSAGHQTAQLPPPPVLWRRGHRRPHCSEQAVVLQRRAWPAEFGEPPGCVPGGRLAWRR